MKRENYCIIDIETTGGSGKNHKVTEIAMIKFDGHKILDKFSTLINPERNIPYNISVLTGIDNEMVANAPKFFEVAKQIIEFLGKDIFVAHNVFFDFNILKSEFNELGYTLKADKLCTVKMGRKYIPGHASYSLGKICKDLEIEITNRHRALGDALATVELLRVILHNCGDDSLESNLSGADRLLLPDHLNQEEVDKLPEDCGIYYFLDSKMNIIYIGKSVNIRTRVKGHFRPDLKRNRDIQLKKNVHTIDYQVIGNEWVALIVEANEIKKHRPQFNRALNRVNFRFAIDLIENGDKAHSELRVVSSGFDNDLAHRYRSKKMAIKVLSGIYDEAFGSNPDRLNWNVFKNSLEPAPFNAQLRKVFLRHMYPEEEFTVELLGMGRELINLVFSEGELRTIEWFKEGERLRHYQVKDDPDIKRIVLKKLKKYYKGPRVLT